VPGSELLLSDREEMPYRLQICRLALFLRRDYGQQFISGKWTASTWEVEN
jgi:hypothetical protein